MMRGWIFGGVVCGLVLAGSPAARGDELSDALSALKAAQPGAAGQAAAAAAWKTVASQPLAHMTDVLAALDDAGPLAANWLRAAVEAIGERAAAAGDKSAAPALEKFVLATEHSPRARRLAYDWLVRFDPAAENRLMAGFLNDPSTELRRDAVARVLEAAEKAAGDAEKKTLYQQAFAASRDVDQINAASAALEKLGTKVDLPSHFGFVTSWKVIGPFDNKGEKGFNVVYPPEEKIDLAAKYAGKDGKEVAWIDHTTADKYGDVDLNKALGKNKGAAAYAYAEFRVGAETPVDIRIGAISAIKLWVNGQLLDSREVYHSGTEIDQYVSRTKLKPGVNQILVKVCENEQTENWAQDWKFQLRVCDATGTAVLSQDRVAAK
jgi:hypothetical protein